MSEPSPAQVKARFVFDSLSQKIGLIIMSSAETALSAVADQLGKAKAEVDALVAELSASDVSPALVSRLQALGQSFDDIVPDVTPAPEPTPEPPAV